jgi:pimeloyl-ACP methyl ester carboxylesterase
MTPDPLGALGANDRLRANLDAAVTAFGLSDPEPEHAMPSSARKRAYRDPRAGSQLATVSLVQDDDVLKWAYDPPPTSARRSGRRAIAAAATEDVVHSFQFLEVPPNQVIAALSSLDGSLTPTRGLRRWTNGTGAAIAKVPAGRLLLLVHGTFSKGEMFFEELAATPEGQSFLAAAEQKYDAVLTFDHPTLSMSPWLNALDLSRALDGAAGPIDVICHSRGGLVTAWWLFHARPPVERVVFVGSPLEGTSLAAPARLKAALDLLGNLARAVGTMSASAATAVPLLAAAGGLMKILGGMLSFGAGTPLVDAGVAIVPGLASQSRVANNYELLRLFADQWAKPLALHSVSSDYAPPAPDAWWKFWQYFRQIPGRIADWGADAIFDGPNDLVVDTASMTELGALSIPAGRRLVYAAAKGVHHCAYFRQPDTVDFLTSVLKL